MGDVLALVAVTIVRLNGKRLQPGTAFVASDAIARELRGAEAARDAREDEIPFGELPAMSEARIRAIAGAVSSRRLNDDDWTQVGTPKVAALAALLGFTPTAEEAARFKRG